MFKSLRVNIVFFVAALVRVPVKIRDTYWLGDYDGVCSDVTSGQEDLTEAKR